MLYLPYNLFQNLGINLSNWCPFRQAVPVKNAHRYIGAPLLVNSFPKNSIAKILLGIHNRFGGIRALEDFIPLGGKSFHFNLKELALSSGISWGSKEAITGKAIGPDQIGTWGPLGGAKGSGTSSALGAQDERGRCHHRGGSR